MTTSNPQLFETVGAERRSRWVAQRERARADHLTITNPGDGSAYAYATKPSGDWYCVWASAGSHIDPLPGFLVIFSCQCPAGNFGQRRYPEGQTGCKHTALLAHELLERRIVTLDFEGRFRSPVANNALPRRLWWGETKGPQPMTPPAHTGDLTLDLVTSRYQAGTKILDAGYVPVGTTRGNPRFKLPFSLAGRFLKVLAPDRDVFNLAGEDFIAAYRAQLDRTGVDAIGEALEAMAAKEGTGRLALLCFEDVHAGQLCHRRVLADWLAEHGWDAIPELP